MDVSDNWAWTDVVAVGVSFVALVMSGIALRQTSKHNKKQHQATMYQERKAVHDDVKAFADVWVQNGTPDMSQRHLLGNAWDRSQFICRPEVTEYIREMLDGAAKCVFLENIVKGTQPGDPHQAADEQVDLMQRFTDGKERDDVFSPDLTVN